MQIDIRCQGSEATGIERHWPRRSELIGGGNRGFSGVQWTTKINCPLKPPPSSSLASLLFSGTFLLSSHFSHFLYYTLCVLLFLLYPETTVQYNSPERNFQATLNLVSTYTNSKILAVITSKLHEVTMLYVHGKTIFFTFSLCYLVTQRLLSNIYIFFY